MESFPKFVFHDGWSDNQKRDRDIEYIFFNFDSKHLFRNMGLNHIKICFEDMIRPILPFMGFFKETPLESVESRLVNSNVNFPLARTGRFSWLIIYRNSISADFLNLMNLAICLREVTHDVDRIQNTWEEIEGIYSRAHSDIRWAKEWANTNTIGIANEIKEENDFSLMPLLADAMEDAGCSDEVTLQNIRTGPFGLSNWTLYNLNKQEESR